ncbi:MAG: G1 family glutamic endopeptidase [Terriglobales bacterium]|jgi:hypothetical protein
MQNQNWRFLSKVTAVAAVTVLVVSFSTFAMAQRGDAVHAMFVSAPKEATNIAGVSIIADRPKGFNPLTASSEELGRYGLPQRPDQQADAKGYARWKMAMQAVRYRAAAHLEAKPYSSTNLKLVKQRPAAAAISGQPATSNSFNWSGVANTNGLLAWDSSQSFNNVFSVWNVPAAQPPSGACAGGITGGGGVSGFFEVSWNGIDGVPPSEDVLQGGSLSYAICGATAATYEGWVEWYPSYPILVIWCGPGPQTGETMTPCPVSAGDDFLVNTLGAAGTADQSVFVEDTTQGWYGTFVLSWKTGPGLVGSSEEWVVERPCTTSPCDTGADYAALANYQLDFFELTTGSDGAGDTFYAGAQESTTLYTMYDDGDHQIISSVEQGSGGYQGLQSVAFFSSNCTTSGGCTP